MENDQDKNEVSFGGGNGTAVAGILAGMVIALGVPTVLLIFGQALGVTALLWLVITAVVMGAGVSIVSAFFGLVMPNHVRGKFMQPDAWRAFAREARAWEHEGHRSRHFGPPWTRWKNEGGAWREEADQEQAAKPAKRRKRA